MVGMDTTRRNRTQFDNFIFSDVCASRLAHKTVKPDEICQGESLNWTTSTTNFGKIYLRIFQT